MSTTSSRKRIHADAFQGLVLVAGGGFNVLFDDVDELAIAAATALHSEHSSALFRKRWDSNYLIGLVLKENSFVAEYRHDPAGFNDLLNLLYDSLTVNKKMAALQSSRSGSGPITPDSRLGCALIMLAGGRRIEAMRTHGLSEPGVYANFKRVVRAVNACPALAIEYDRTVEGLEARAAGFKKKVNHGLLKYCVDCIDGLSLSHIAPSEKETSNQRRFYSGLQ